MESDNPSRDINCPKCGGTEVFSCDNQPLWHPLGFGSTEVTKNTLQYDNEIYVSLKCTEKECGHEFTKVFNLTLQE